MPSALITGLLGQDGVLLSKFLLDKGYEVHGLVRRDHRESLVGAYPHLADVRLTVADLSGWRSFVPLLSHSRPSEVYNLAGLSSVANSWDQPSDYYRSNVLFAQDLFEAIRNLQLESTSVYQASSSEMFGHLHTELAHEGTQLNPESPYAVSKVAAHQLARIEREHFGLRISCGILFNHESPLRSKHFLSKQICDGVVSILTSKRSSIDIRDVTATRDWGSAADFVEAMWLMTQRSDGSDYVIATSVLHSVHDFLTEAFEYVGISNWGKFVRTSEKSTRSRQSNGLVGDIGKARRELNWQPRTEFRAMVRELMEHALREESHTARDQ